MKWIGQHIWDFISRFRNDVYLEDIDTGTIVSGGNLGLDSNNKIVKNTVSGGGDNSSLKITVKNDTASTIGKGRAVHITGEDAGGNTTVILADYNSAATMPAAGVANESIAAGATGEIITMGEISGVNTTGFTEGDEVWVAANGLYTTTRPAGESLLVQKLAVITHVDASNGAGIIMGAGRVNDVPNLDEDAIFLGNSSNQAEATDLSSVNISLLNNDAGYTANTGDITDVSIRTDQDGINNAFSSGAANYTILSGEGIDVTSSGTGNITVAGEVATSANLGVAKFNTSDFDVDAGDVTIKSGGVDLTTQVTGELPVGNFATKDEDDMTSDSATHVPTQQSVKAYVDSKEIPWMSFSFYFNPNNSTKYYSPGNQGIMNQNYTNNTTDYDDSTDKVVWWRQNGIIVPSDCTLTSLEGAVRYGYSKGYKFKFLHIPAASIIYDAGTGNNSGLDRVAEATCTFTTTGQGYLDFSWSGTTSLSKGDMLIPMMKNTDGDYAASTFVHVSLSIKV